MTVRQHSGCDTVEVNLAFRAGVNWTVDNVVRSDKDFEVLSCP